MKLNNEQRKTLLKDLRDYLTERKFETWWDIAGVGLPGGEPLLSYKNILWISVCRKGSGSAHIHLIPKARFGETDDDILIPLADPEYKKRTIENITAFLRKHLPGL